MEGLLPAHFMSMRKLHFYYFFLEANSFKMEGLFEKQETPKW